MTLSSDRVVLKFHPGLRSIEVVSGRFKWAEPEDTDLFHEDWREVYIQTYTVAVDELMEMQNYSGHAKCPNTRNPPVGCQTCLNEFGDANAVWKRVMIINREWKK